MPLLLTLHQNLIGIDSQQEFFSVVVIWGQIGTVQWMMLTVFPTLEKL
jgi:hypothetical protein